MTVITFRRAAAVSVSAIVLGLATLNAPPPAMVSVLLIVALGAIVFSVKDATRYWRRSRRQSGDPHAR